MGEGDDLGALGDHRVQVGQVETALVGQADPAQGGTGAPGKLLPRHEVGVVLHLGDHDLVAHPEREPRCDRRVDTVHRPFRRSVAEGVGDQVQRLGGVLGEHDLPRLGADKGGHGLTGTLEGVGGLFGQLMGTPVNCGVLLLVEGALGIEHLARLLRGRPGVEVHQGLPAAHGARQDREVSADRGRLCRAERGAGSDIGHG